MVYHLKEWKYIIDLAKIEPWVIEMPLEKYCRDPRIIRDVVNKVSIMTTAEGVETAFLSNFDDITMISPDELSFEKMFKDLLISIDKNAEIAKESYYEQHKVEF